MYYLDVALNGPCNKPLHWVYVPEAQYPFYRVGCYSNFSAAMAPPGKANLYVELADRSPPDMATLVPEVARGLVEMGLIDVPEAVRFARLRVRDLRPRVLPVAGDHPPLPRRVERRVDGPVRGLELLGDGRRAALRP
jgi:hypothetical protein